MGLPEIVEYARNFSVMVRVHGPDPKGLKMRNHAFHHFSAGKTTLSASGLLLTDTLFNAEAADRMIKEGGGGETRGGVLVVTVASVIEPFLSPRHRGGQSISQGRPELIPGAQIDVMLEGKLKLEEGNEDGLASETSGWVAAQVVTLVDVPPASLALQVLIEASSGILGHEWDVGWSLASQDKGPHPLTDGIWTQSERGSTSFVGGQRPLEMGESGSRNFMTKSTTKIAVLGVSLYLKDLPNITIHPSTRRGDFILAMGSPFGVLTPLHFFNSLSVGSITNCYPPSSSNMALLMADIRCLPGMEGGPVFDKHARLVGVLIRPLRQKSSGAEIQLVIPWKAIATACSDLLQKEPQNSEKGIHINKENLNAVGNAYSHELDGPLLYKDNQLNFYCPSPLLVERAMASICLITVDEGVWASGVLLNDQGLILTNAHLLEPWRFGKTTVNGGLHGTQSEAVFSPHEANTFPSYNEVDGCRNNQSLSLKSLNFTDSSVANGRKGQKLTVSSGGHRNIRVRLDVDSWVWCDAKVVYICKGPLDVALLQLEHVPDQLCPISVDFVCPSLGSKAYVIGHGLFGPKCGLSPSICTGVVGKVVKAKVPLYHQGEDLHIPAMLETTAAVHPGGSGGAVVNVEGRMIGLVTSNARHAGGTVIPHLNFSIPCAALEPIFEFARDMQDKTLLLNLDQPNEHLSSVWALMPPLSPKPSPPLPNPPRTLLEDNSKQEKASKFAKFIAERDKVWRSSSHIGKRSRIANDIIPSKL